MTSASLFPMPVVRLIAGVDEAGRGPLAGPVAVAAVILDASRPIDGLNDSKQLSEAKREALLRANFRDLGIGLFEFARAWWGDVAPMRASASIEGLEILQGLQAEGRGVLLVSGHFMTLELCGRLLCDHVPLAGMYRKYRSPVMEWAVLRGRLRYAIAMFGNADTRAAIRHLKRGGVLWYAPDQDMRGKDTVFAPFFGIPAATITATHQFARMTGCAVVPFFHRREGDRYVLKIGEPLAPFPTEDAVADSTAVNAAISQFMSFETEVGVDDNQPTYAALEEFLPRLYPEFLAARQQADRFDVSPLNTLHVPVGYLSLAALALAMLFHRRLGLTPEARALGLTLFAALAANAVVCGVFSHPVDRYQSRLVLLVPFVVAVLAARWITARTRTS